MTHVDELIQQRILEYEARLRHIDELVAQAHEKATESEDHTELAGIKQQREALADHIETLRRKPRENWQPSELERAGPMGLWDVVAQQLERLVERLGG